MEIVESRHQDGIALIRMNSPETRNALSEQMCWSLIDKIRVAEEDPGIAVIVLSSTFGTFCAGGDISEFSQARETPAPVLLDKGRQTTALFRLLDGLRTPMIAAVEGAALGGGFGLTCASHLVVAAKSACFGLTELRLGIFPLVVLPAVRNLLGERKTLELSLTASIIEADEAASLGVVNEIVAEGAAEEAALDLARKIASRSVFAVRTGLAGLVTSREMDTATAIEYLNALRVVFLQSEDLHEGMSAFLEKRSPVWRGV